MKKFMLLAIMVLAGCADRTVTSKVTAIDGQDGKNGHSIVSQYNETSEIECINGGSRLDIYIDLDDSLSTTEGDLYTNSLVVCNGANGLNGQQGAQGETGPAGSIGPQGVAGATGAQGPVGPQGPTGPTGASGSGATITSFTSSSCTSLGNGYYGKSSSNTYGIYDDNDCHSSDKVIDLNDANSSFWLSGSVLGIFTSPNDLRVINFN